MTILFLPSKKNRKNANCCYFYFSTTWHKEPYSRGSYTALGIGGLQSHIEKLAEPLYQRPYNRTVSTLQGAIKQRNCIEGVTFYANASIHYHREPCKVLTSQKQQIFFTKVVISWTSTYVKSQKITTLHVLSIDY